VRFTRPGDLTEDNIAMQSFQNEISQKHGRIPLICFNTGLRGHGSVCFNRVLTSLIPASFRDGPGFADRVARNPETSWLTVQEVTRLLYASFTLDSMRFFSIGAHVGSSISPAMHKAAYKATGMLHTFTIVQPSTLNDLQELAQDPHFGGAAISQHSKFETMSLAHSMSRHARAIGSVDTLLPVHHINDDGSLPGVSDILEERHQAGPIKALYGESTDWLGIRSCILRGLSPANAVRPSTCGLITGAGVMARAAVYAMLQLGINRIAIYNQTLENAEELVAYFNRIISSSSGANLLPMDNHPLLHVFQSQNDAWPDDVQPPTIILSTIGDSSESGLILPSQWMHSRTGGVVLELGYKSSTTPFMKQIREGESGPWVCLDGLDLLAEQSFVQFELFTGKRAPRRIMREEMLRLWKDGQGQYDALILRTMLEMFGDVFILKEDGKMKFNSHVRVKIHLLVPEVSLRMTCLRRSVTSAHGPVKNGRREYVHSKRVTFHRSAS
jgi:shikimate 5-dehydrogenase